MSLTSKQARIPYQHRLHLAAKASDLNTAYAIYDEMMEAGILPNADMCGVILSLCSRVSKTFDAERVQRAVNVFESTMESSVPPTESGYSCVIRLLCACGNVVAARAYYYIMTSLGIHPHMRTITPFLEYAATTHDVRTATKMEEDIVRFHLTPTQADLAALLLTYKRANACARAAAILTTIMETVDVIEPSLEIALTEYFGTAVRTDIKSTVCPISGVTLQRIEVPTDTLCEQIVSIAGAHIDEFRDWLVDKTFDVVIDAANVGFFGQNHEGGALLYSQIDLVVRSWINAGHKPLIVIGSKWLDSRVYTKAEKRAAADTVRRNRSGIIVGTGVAPKDGAVAPTKRATMDSTTAADLIAGWQRDALVYSVSRGTNDDLYWLYAAVTHNAQLVTNDMLRDHHFQMITAAKTLERWAELYVVPFVIAKGKPKFQLPAPYTRRPQHTDTVWHFPTSKKYEWLVCTECTS